MSSAANPLRTDAGGSAPFSKMGLLEPWVRMTQQRKTETEKQVREVETEPKRNKEDGSGG